MKTITFSSIEKNSILFIMIFFSFRDIFIRLGVENLIIMFSFSLLIFESLLNIEKGTINKRIIIPFIIIVMGLFQLIINFQKDSAMNSIIGFVSIFGYLMFWTLVFNKYNKLMLNGFKKKFYKWISWIGIINSILGIYQYFIDPSILGLVTNKIYGNSNILLNPNVTRRVVGFLGSPQNYSLFIGISFLTAQQVFVRNKIRFIVLPILIFGGLLSGSRTFFLFIAISILIKLIPYGMTKGIILKKRSIKYFVLLAFLLPISLLYMSNIQNVDYTFLRVFDFNSWPALNVFISQVKNLDIKTLLIGNGFTFGVYSGVSSNLDFSQYESYIISILFRAGFVQTFLVILIFLTALKKTYLQRDFITMGIVIVLIINIFITPSFGGLQMSFFIWPIILMPFLQNKKKEERSL